MESGDVHLVSMDDKTLGMLVPSKLYAALAVHRPCLFVGPAGCEVAHVIEEFGAGAVIPQGDAARLAGEIQRLRLDSDVWFAAHQGAAKAAEIFTPAACLSAWDKVLENMMEEKL